MKNILTISLKLSLICIFSAFGLAYINTLTAPKIAEIKARRLKEALMHVSEGGEVEDFIAVEEHPGITGYYPVSGPEKTGYILKLIGKGYAGDLNLLASFAVNGAVLNAVLMENQETSGLGKKAEEPGYMDKFKGYGARNGIPGKKSQLKQQDADAVSGATITFSGIGKALQNGSDFVKTLGER